ncbi:unnamed protein product [Cladocopium goreaui]|uniref:Transposon protein n=1 Tax=Cladocopium goreaui TaxID=2562237 RepID=A0A9P1C7H5_9DINO|nr:unnamed protein product [Cladocopium goreaui]
MALTDKKFADGNDSPVLQRRSPIGMSDCRSLYDHLITLGCGGTLDDKRVAIDVAVIRQSIARSRLQPRWVPTDRMVADGLTKDKGEPLDLLRSVFRNARYQLADEKEARIRRQELGRARKENNQQQTRHVEDSAEPANACLFEMQLVRDILARMEAQGTPMPPALWSSGHLGAMSDGSKRLRDQDDFPSSEDELLGEKCAGRTSEDFELIRDAPKSSVESVEKWGATICALPEVKEEAPTYHEIGTLSKFKEYRN